MPAGAAAAFLLAAPYTVLELPTFLDAFGRLSNHYSRGARLPEAASVTYLKHLRNSMGTPGLVLAIASLAIMAWQFTRTTALGRSVIAMLLVFVTAWFTMTADQGGIRYARYLLPLLPGLALLMGASIAVMFDGAARWRPRPLVRAGVISVILLVAVGRPTYASWQFARDSSRTWTTALVYDWLLGNVPAGSHVVVETRQILLPAERFVSTNVPRLIERTADEYVEAGVQYLVASSQSFGPFIEGDAQSSPEGQAYRALFRRLQLVHHVSPSADHPGAELRVYRLVP